MGGVMKFRLSAMLRETAGQSAVELALVLPLLLILALGVFEFSRAIQANSIITNMSREGASLASRTSRDQQDIMNSLAYAAQPLTMDTDGMMYLTEVKNVVGVPTIQLPQKALRANTVSLLNSRIDQTNVADCLGGIVIPDGQTVYIFEVVYRYNFVFKTSSPLLDTTLLDPTILYSATIF
jgi:hypothetical protein